MRWIRLSIVASVLGGLALYLLNRVAGWWPVFTALSIHVATGTLIFGLERLLPTSLPDGYYRLRRVERGGTVYRRLGVPAFRRAVLASVFGRSPLVQFGGTRADLVRYLQVTRNAEMGHLLLLVATAPAIVEAFRLEMFRTGAWLVAITLVWNLYPILLQRYTRGRLERTLAKGRRRDWRPGCDKQAKRARDEDAPDAPCHEQAPDATSSGIDERISRHSSSG
jgi:hypothetical protein